MITANKIEWSSCTKTPASWNTRLRGLVLTSLERGKKSAASLREVGKIWQKHSVRKILRSSVSHVVVDDEAVFNELQSSYQKRPEYGYDSASCLKRGSERAKILVGLFKGIKRNARILEAACGDGVTGWCLSALGYDVHLHDLEDWRDERALRLPMTIGDLNCSLPIREGSFDFIFSYNSFEHVTDPAASLQELLRLCRSGGLVFLEFGPLYASPWGLHAYRTLLMPYPQFLFSDDFIRRKLDLLGIHDLGRKRAALQPLNRWRIADFDALWQRSGCEIVRSSKCSASPLYPETIMRYPGAFRGLALTHADVTIQSVQVLLRKIS